MNYTYIILYFVIANIFGGSVFAYDKTAAIKNKSRISELKLHFLELVGGIFANILLMYILRHKNRKFRYWIWTWLILILWILVPYLCILI